MSASLALTVRRAGKPPEDIVTSTDDLRAILDRADAATEMLAVLRNIRSQIHNLPRSATADRIEQLAATAIAKVEGRI